MLAVPPRVNSASCARILSGEAGSPFSALQLPTSFSRSAPTVLATSELSRASSRQWRVLHGSVGDRGVILASERPLRACRRHESCTRPAARRPAALGLLHSACCTRPAASTPHAAELANHTDSPGRSSCPLRAPPCPPPCTKCATVRARALLSALRHPGREHRADAGNQLVRIAQVIHVDQHHEPSVRFEP